MKPADFKKLVTSVKQAGRIRRGLQRPSRVTALPPGGRMAVLTIKNLPGPLYARLKVWAASNNRSLNGEAIACLEQALAGATAVNPELVLDALRKSRGRLRCVWLTDQELAKTRPLGRRDPAKLPKG